VSPGGWHDRPTRSRLLTPHLTNRAVTGTEAASWGLVSRAVPAEHLDDTVANVVSALQRGPSRAYAETKRLIAAAGGRTLSDQLADEAATIAQAAASFDGVEGVDAFLDKRRPLFTHQDDSERL
jgi:2-(1,2-epoxy-1,2-dihydrophenyl)acetyl-CoA isomerase